MAQAQATEAREQEPAVLQQGPCVMNNFVGPE